MPKRKPLTDEEGEIRELLAADFVEFRPALPALPQSIATKLATRRRSQKKASAEERVSIRLPREVVERLRATGEGWQKRLDEALREWLDSHPAA